MKLAKMNIKNYRQFEDATIFYDDNLTILAGANNSGKTSLVELYKGVFIKRDKNFSIEDMPAIKIYESANVLSDLVINIYQNKPDQEDFLNELADNLLKDVIMGDTTQKDILQEIVVDIEVVYDEDEKITRFSDYLMELDSENKSFYFRYVLGLNSKKLYNNIKENFIKIESRIKEYLSIEEGKKENKKTLLRDFIIKQFDLGLEESYYYSNSTYTINILMKSTDFKNLFNCNFISATRDLNDQKEDEHHSISREMLSILKSDKNWEMIIDGMPEDIIKLINNTEIKENIVSGSIEGLQKTIKDISENTDGNVGEISLNVDISDDDIMFFLTKAIEARYHYNNVYLKESSQGLGFSNWIYIYLKIEKYCKSIDTEIVNFFIIEEPEAHMHPQMQRALIKHLNTSYHKNEIQGIITTHSHELVRASKLEKIRVIRQVVPFVNKIYDMNYFKSKLKTKEEKDFFNLLFSINYSDLIFSGKIIMYEGDTEKLFIEALLKHEKFYKLSDQYISYVQVGGAYAHNYKKLINFLSIKTLILTDADYCKKLTLEDDILNEEITNGSIKSFYKDYIIIKEIARLILKVCTACPDESEECFKNMSQYEQLENSLDKNICIKIGSCLEIETKKILDKKIIMKDLYNWVQTEEKKIFIKFQESDDKFARTLEEAMLCKYLEIGLSDKKTRTEWEETRKNEKLKFSIPAKTDQEKENGAKEKEFDIRDIVQATSNSKADFMYSVILNNKEMDMLPHYIEGGLEWLEK